jgi:hypothetical protein
MDTPTQSHPHIPNPHLALERLEHRTGPVTTKDVVHSKMSSRFNSWLAVKITDGVGTMWCAYLFALLALIGLPAALKPGGEGIIAWIAQTFLQLVLLSIIMVGQSVQSAASDARGAKEFADTEIILDRLDVDTAGGIREVLDAIHAIHASFAMGGGPAAPGAGPAAAG